MSKNITLIIKVKDTGNMIGLKEDIAMRLAGVADIERIDVLEDAAEVKHGEWFIRFDGRYSQRRTYCSICGNHSGIGGNKQEPKYCPNCGAKMDGVKHGN